MTNQIYKAIPTNIGITKIQQAMWAGIKLQIVSMAYGDGGGEYYLPTPDQTSLVNQVGITETQSTLIDTETNITWVSAIIGPHLPECTIREIGLFDKDGDLCFIANTPEIDKINVSQGTLVDVPVELGIKNTWAEHISIPVQPSAEFPTKAWVLDNFATRDLDNITEVAKETIRDIALGPIVYEVYEENVVVDAPEGWTPPVDPDEPDEPDTPTEEEEIIPEAEWVEVEGEEADNSNHTS